MPLASSNLRTVAAACAAIFCVTLAGCSGSSDAPQVAQQPPAAAPAASAPAAAAPAPAAPAAKPPAGESTGGGEASGESSPARNSAPSGGGGRASNSEMAESGGEMAASGGGETAYGSSESGESGEMTNYETSTMEMEQQYRNGGNPNGAATNAANNPLAGFMAGFAASATTPTAPSIPDDFRAQAQLAYQHGLETQAHQLFLAHLVSDPLRAKDDYEKLVVSPLQKRPVLSVRWGIGVNVIRDDGYGGDAHPPLEKMAVPSDGPVNNGRQNNRGGSGGAGSDSSMNSSDSMMNSEGAAATVVAPAVGQEAEQFRKDFGMVAEILESEFEKRYSRGDYGSVFASMSTSSPLATPAGNVPGANMNQGGRPGDNSDTPSDATMSGASEGNSAGMSSMESSGSSEMSGMAGMEGMAPGAMSGGMPGGRGPAAAAPSLVLPQPDAPRFRPGLIFVGSGKTEDMLAKARELGLPVIFECFAKVDKKPNNIVQNDMRIRVLDVATGQSLTTCKISNLDIYRETRNPKNPSEENPKRSVSTAVHEQMDAMFNTVDSKIKVRAIPNLEASAVRARVANLLGFSHKDRLLALAELRLYQSRGYLSEDDMAVALDLMLGDEGLSLLSGAPDKQKEIMARFVDRLSP